MNVKEISRNGKVYVFVTRGRSKPFSDSEIEEFFNEQQADTNRFVPEDRHRQLMFLKDIKLGLGFCSRKYGVSEADILAEAHRLAPHIKVRP